MKPAYAPLKTSNRDILERRYMQYETYSEIRVNFRKRRKISSQKGRQLHSEFAAVYHKPSAALPPRSTKVVNTAIVQKPQLATTETGASISAKNLTVYTAVRTTVRSLVSHKTAKINDSILSSSSRWFD